METKVEAKNGTNRKYREKNISKIEIKIERKI
jgi:hypothetical protein